jgi:hypothetical protein
MTADARGLNSAKNTTRSKKDKHKLSDVIDSVLNRRLCGSTELAEVLFSDDAAAEKSLF